MINFAGQNHLIFSVTLVQEKALVFVFMKYHFNFFDLAMHWLLITFVLDHENILIFFTEMIKAKVDAANKQLMAEFESERSHHQRLVKEHSRLQQRLENLQGEMQYLNSPQGHKRTPSDMSAISLESYTSSVSPDEKKEAEEENEKEVSKGR